MRIGQPDRLHRTEQKGVAASFRHHLDRQTAVEIIRLFKIVKNRLFRSQQRVDKPVIFVFRQRTVDIVAAVPFVIARLIPRHLHVNAVLKHHRRNRVVKRQRLAVNPRKNVFCQCLGSERTGGNDHLSPTGRRQRGNLPFFHADQRMGAETAGNEIGKSVAVNRQGTAGRHFAGIGRRHHQRAGQPHFPVQQSDRIVLIVVRTQRVGTNQFGKPRRPVRGRIFLRLHFVQNDRHAAADELPGGFGTGQPGADDMNGFVFHLFPLFLSKHACFIARGRRNVKRLLNGAGRSADFLQIIVCYFRKINIILKKI